MYCKDYKNQKSKEFFEFAVIKSFRDLKKIMKQINVNNEEYCKEVNFRVGTFLYWLLDYYEIFGKENNLKDSEKAFLCGLRYADNTLKYNVDIVRLYDVKRGMHFPIHFPMNSEKISLKWVDIKNIDKRYLNQHGNYCKYVKDKDIIVVSEKALNILKIFIK